MSSNHQINLNYQTRPSKHVERKIFVEVLQHLRSAGCEISKYHYLGFGSPYYVDFILFNRLLSIKKMTCLEKNTRISKRMEFNKPFRFINLKMQDISTYLPNIKTNEKYIVWLDYECPLDKEVMMNIGSLVGSLMKGSILIITVNAHVVLLSENYSAQKIKQIEEYKEQYQTELAPYCGEVKKDDITTKKLPELFVRSIKEKISEALRGRPEDDFHQIFNYVYRDGANMLTFGGIIDDKNNIENIKESLSDLKYINNRIIPRKITIPNLTVREKLLLDQKITKKSTVGCNLPFELDSEEKDAYIEYSTHYPTFHEVFMN